LDTITPRQFDEWVAFYRAEPDQTDRLRVIITGGFLALSHAWGVEIEPRDLDPFLDEESADSTMTPEAAAAAAQLAYGFS
jgi:hypothetical protein